MRKLLLLVTSLISLGTIIFGQSIDQSIISNLREILELDERAQLPGGAVLILQDEQVIYSKYFGLANLNDGTPITEHTRFHLNFSTQSVIAQAILNFIEKDSLSPSDPIRNYIPELPQVAKDVTIEHLLEHTSGLYDYWALKSLGGWDYDDVFKKHQAFHMLSNVKELVNPPGERYNFSNTNYFLLAEVLRRISGTSLDILLKKEFFGPLGMSSAFISENYASPVKNKASYYFDYGEGHQTSFAKYGDDAGTIGLYATLNDFRKWVSFIDSDNEAKLTVNYKEGIHKGLNFQYQDGYYFGYRGFVGKFIEAGLTVILLSNDYYFNTHDKGLAIADQFLPTESRTALNQSEPSESILDIGEIIGHYWDSADMHSKRIELRNDTLYYQLPRGWSSPLVLDNGKFKIVNSSSNRSIRFYKNNGAMRMTIDRDGQPTNHYTRYNAKQYSIDDLNSFTGAYHTEVVNTIYDLKVENGYLMATNLRTEDIILDPLTEDRFASEDAWFFSQIEFKRNDEGQITGFFLSTPEIKNLWFDKLK